MNVWAYNVRGSLEWKATTDKEQAKKMAESPRFEVRPTREAEPAAPVDARDAQRQNDFALGRLQGIQQERALWELSAIAQAESQISNIDLDAAIARQAAAPAEGEK